MQQPEEQTEKVEDPPKPEIKKETKAVDLKVFVGSEAFVPPENPFSVQIRPLAPEVSSEVKSRLSSVSTLVEKLRQRLLTQEGATDQAETKVEGKKKKCVTSCVRYDASRFEDPEGPDFRIVSTAEPKFYEGSVQSVIDRLKSKVESVPIPEVGEKSVSFLDVLKSINQDDSSASEDEKDPAADEKKPDEEFLAASAESRGPKISLTDLKDEKSLQELMKPVNLKHLFKCMSKTDCSFSSDNAAKFQLHLDEVHSGQDSKSRHGWLRCSVCLKKLGSPSSLVRHVIKHHGSCPYQCPNCFCREPTELGLFVHHLVSHRHLQPSGFIECKSFQMPPTRRDDDAIDEVRPPPMKCREKNCGYETSLSNEMSNHLFVEHSGNATRNFQDFGCVFCRKTFSSASLLVRLSVFLLHILPSFWTMRVEGSGAGST